MKNVKSRPALIVFCREPIAHHVKTRLIGAITAEAAAALSDAFIRDVLAKAVSIRPSRIVIAASAPDGARSKYFQRLARRFDADLVDQGSGSLGKRMARALEPISSKGALLIGTDTPSLPTELLASSLDALRRHRVVIAPSLDGGYYALGVRGSKMPPIFTAIRWGTRSVFDSTVKRLKRAGIPYALGPAWYDVDRWADVLLLAAHLRLLARSRRRTNASPCPATESVLVRLGVLRHDR